MDTVTCLALVLSMPQWCFKTILEMDLNLETNDSFVGTALESRLENSGLNRALQKAITLLIENRPKNPLQFLSAQ